MHLLPEPPTAAAPIPRCPVQQHILGRLCAVPATHHTPPPHPQKQLDDITARTRTPCAPVAWCLTTHPLPHPCQVLHELHVPDDPLYRADVSPINPDTPEPEAEALPPPPPQPAAGTAPDAAAATAAAAICGAIKHALATGLLPHEQQLAASAPAPAPAVEGSAVAAAATAAAVAAAPADGPLPPRPFTGSATVVDYVRAYRSGERQCGTLAPSL